MASDIFLGIDNLFDDFNELDGSKSKSPSVRVRPNSNGGGGTNFLNGGMTHETSEYDTEGGGCDTDNWLRLDPVQDTTKTDTIKINV